MLITSLPYIITGIFLLAYANFTYLLCKGWRDIPTSTNPSSSHTLRPTCAIIVACHNEEKYLPKLLLSIEQQTYTANEIIFIDDHSSDNTHLILQQWAATHPNTQILSAVQRGKKAALRQGVCQATSQLILCTDADCQCPSHWVEHITTSYAQSPFDLLILPVTTYEDNHFLSHITRLEFISLVSSGMALAALYHPIMCNGANLACKRDTWLAMQDYLHSDLLSGDDVFLLHAIKRHKGVIRVLAHPDTLVVTHPVITIRDFLRQRIRWGSKTSSYTDTDTLYVASLIFTISLYQVILYCFAPFHPSCAICACSLFYSKWIFDTIFLRHTQATFTLSHLWFNTLTLSILYPFYIVITACLGCFQRSKW